MATLGEWAERRPSAPAIVSDAGNRTFAELDAGANQIARGLRARGLRAGDGVALLCGNRPEFAEVLYACQRAGFRLTPINWHLGADGEHGQGVGVDGDVASAGAGLEAGELEAVADRRERLGDLDAAGVEVDVVPAQTEDLATAHPGGGGQAEQHRVAVLGGVGEEVAELIGGPRAGAPPARGPLAWIWRMGSGGGVRYEQTPIGGVVEGRPDDLVEVLDRLRRERSAAPAAGEQQPPVERLEVFGLESPQWRVAEVGEQVVLDAGDVAGVRRRCEGRLLGGNPLAEEVLAEGQRRAGAALAGAAIGELGSELAGGGAVLAAVPPSASRPDTGFRPS